MLFDSRGCFSRRACSARLQHLQWLGVVFVYGKGTTWGHPKSITGEKGEAELWWRVNLWGCVTLALCCMMGFLLDCPSVNERYSEPCLGFLVTWKYQRFAWRLKCFSSCCTMKSGFGKNVDIVCQSVSLRLFSQLFLPPLVTVIHMFCALSLSERKMWLLAQPLQRASWCVWFISYEIFVMRFFSDFLSNKTWVSRPPVSGSIIGLRVTDRRKYNNWSEGESAEFNSWCELPSCWSLGGLNLLWMSYVQSLWRLPAVILSSSVPAEWRDLFIYLLLH